MFKIMNRCSLHSRHSVLQGENTLRDAASAAAGLFVCRLVICLFGQYLSRYVVQFGACRSDFVRIHIFFEQVAALRLYAEHPAYDGQLLVVCFQNIAAAERVVDHLRRIEMLPQVDVEDLIMSRCAKNGTAEKPQSRFFAVALRYSVSKSCDSLCPFSSTRNDTRWRCSLEMSLCLKTI